MFEELVATIMSAGSGLHQRWWQRARPRLGQARARSSEAAPISCPSPCWEDYTMATAGPRRTWMDGRSTSYSFPQAGTVSAVASTLPGQSFSIRSNTASTFLS